MQHDDDAAANGAQRDGVRHEQPEARPAEGALVIRVVAQQLVAAAGKGMLGARARAQVQQAGRQFPLGSPPDRVDHDDRQGGDDAGQVL